MPFNLRSLMGLVFKVPGGAKPDSWELQGSVSGSTGLPWEHGGNTESQVLFQASYQNCHGN